MKKIKEEKNKSLYALIITETKEILNPNTFSKYWKNYGKNELHGWRPPKKIYFELHHAKNGFHHIPDEIKDHVSIAKFGFEEIILDGKDIKKVKDKI